jgi:1-pyrroline-5-carboxylate dehydrogenase
MEYRPLEGFVYAISPFNFTAIGGNLTTAPALMGNTVIWKPASSAVLSGYYTLKLLEEAGMPPGVINFIPGDARDISNQLLDSPELAGVHFTGSTEVFNRMWKKIGENIGRYRGYPRLVGETGGKDSSSSIRPPIRLKSRSRSRAADSYRGRSVRRPAGIRPRSLWNDIRDRTVAMMKEIKVGDVADFRNFMGAVIDQKSFTKISGYLDDAKRNAKILSGGTAKGDDGVASSTDAHRDRCPSTAACARKSSDRSYRIFYPDNEWRGTLDVVVARLRVDGRGVQPDRTAVREAMSALRNSAGNFYINDKPTGAVVGQQPFGGARASGTNDKAGSMLNLVRWSARERQETFVPPRDTIPVHGGEVKVKS